MKANVLAFGMVAVTAFPLAAQEVGVTSSHRPNEHTQSCLLAPTRDCAIGAALQTVIDETLPLERSKVLVGVARGLIDAGDTEQGLQTLTLAMAEARAANLNLVTQDRLKTIAPLFARAGDFASAMALVGEIDIRMLKDRTLLAVSEEAIRMEDPAAARSAIKQLSNKQRAFWQNMNLYLRGGDRATAGLDLSALEAEVDALKRPGNRYRGLVSLEAIARKLGRVGLADRYAMEASEMFSSIIGINERASAAIMGLKAIYDAGLDKSVVLERYDDIKRHFRTRVAGELALVLGPIEAAIGRSDEALSRLNQFESTDEKALYVSRLNFNGHENGAAAHVSSLLDEINKMDGAYERDSVRITLLEGAVANKATKLALDIVATLEDDDNQAFGLSVTASII